MAGSLTVNIIMPLYWTAYGGAPGAWAVDGGAWNASGVTVAGLAAGEHVVSFQYEGTRAPGNPNVIAQTPVNQTVEIVDAETMVTWGTYCVIAPETLLETGCFGLEETPCHALDTANGKPLFLGASSMDAAFSAYGPAQPMEEQGAAFTAAQVMGAAFEETYSLMLEGGLVASDFASAGELAAIAAIVAPYLTAYGSALAGGVPIRCGYKLVSRTVNSWTIQRGKGFSLQGAIDANFIAGYPGPVNIPWTDIDSEPGPEQVVNGFCVHGNGFTFPNESPGACTGMTGVPNQLPYHSPVSGYPLQGGANISQIGTIAGAISIHGVNAGDGTINPAINTAGVQTDAGHGVGGTSSVSETSSYIDYYGTLHPGGGMSVSEWNGFMFPKYYVGSPDYYWYADGSSESWILTWHLNQDIQTNSLPFALIFWIGTNPSNVPQASFQPPEGNNIGTTPPGTITTAYEGRLPLTDATAMAPANRNAEAPYGGVPTFTAAQFGLFSLQ